MEEVEPGWRVYSLDEEQVFEPELPYDYGQGADKMYFSNFVLTISTNVVPEDNVERAALADWLRIQANNLFDDFYRLNGTVLKPAGSPNAQNLTLGLEHRIEGVRSRITLERGTLRGQMHMHVVMEVAHRYTQRNEWNKMGVHVNTTAIRNYLQSQIPSMEIDPDRRPTKIYVNSRLIANLNNQQTKWMALQYIHKDVDKDGNSIAAMEQRGTANDRNIIEGIRDAPDRDQFDWKKRNVGLGGALVDAANQPLMRRNDSDNNNYGDPDSYGVPQGENDTDDDGDRRSRFAPQPPPVKRAPRVRIPPPADGSSSWDNRPLNAIWTNSGRTAWKKKK